MLGAKIINGFKNLNILCIGDIMLDKFLYGEVERISPEAPVPIFKVTKEKSMLGGTGNVIANLAALGVQTMFIGAAGNDESSVMLEHFLDKTGCNYSLIKPDNYPTTTKIRMIASNNHLLRADKESFLNADESVLKELSEMLEKVVDKADIVLVSDYKKGLLTLQSTQMIIQTCKKHGKKVLLDPKERDFSKYAGADIVKPNLKEFELVSGKKFDTSSATFKQEIKQAEVKQTYEPGEEIAIMRVNSVGLETVIVEGTDNKYLKYYACHFEGTAMPGEEGNFSVAGHSSYLYNQVFNELHKVKINDEIEIETTKGIFKYKITEKFDTEAENTSVLTQDMSKKEITLVTCTNGGKKRLIIKGEIME